MIGTGATVSGALLLLLAAPAGAQEPKLATVMQRAAAYVAEFHRQLSGVVAEERYTQEVKALANQSSWRSVQRRTELKSDLFLVQPSGGGDWIEFRDVFEANGTPVRDRAERLTKLFLDGSRSAQDQIGDILDESSRFNIGEIKRNINTPVFALQILERERQGRFKFKRSNDRIPAIVSQEPTVPARTGRRPKCGGGVRREGVRHAHQDRQVQGHPVARA